MLRGLFVALSHSRRLQQLALSHPRLRSAARRFVAGERLEDALDVLRSLAGQGLWATLDHLGEGVTTTARAEESQAAYVEILDALHAGAFASHLSLRLTQLGLDVDPSRCVSLLSGVLDRAGETFVRIDMEDSARIDRTLAVFDAMWAEGRRNVGVVIQSYLYRSARDVERLVAMGARVRLVKGAYAEPPSVAYPRKQDVDLNFARLAEVLLVRGSYPAIATHDEHLIDIVIRIAEDRGMSRDRFEFQMMYGIRRDLQVGLHRRGYGVRIYVPFGTEWYPYFMRRLGERPANALFVVRNLLRERRFGRRRAGVPVFVMSRGGEGSAQP